MKSKISKPKALLSFVIVLMLLIGSVPTGASADAHLHDDVLFSEWTSTNSLPPTAGNYYLSSDITISSTWNVPSGTTKLCLNGHSIKMTGSGSVIQVGSGATFSLYDCGTNTNYYDVQNAAANGAGLATNINDVSGTYSFTGGYITGGNAKDGGGVLVNGGSFIQYGGTIIGNSATGTDSRGGGVRIMGPSGSEKYCKESLSKALAISKEKTSEYIELLYCEPEYKARMKELAEQS